MESIRIVIILGTAREGRQSEKVARYARRFLAGLPGVDAVFVDVRAHLKLATVGTDDHGTAWNHIAAEADGYIIVSPEYNHGYPGELKMLLDSAYKEYHQKPVGVVGVSDGPIAGVRMMEQLRQVAVALGLVPVRAAVYVANVSKIWNEDGPLADREEFDKRLAGLAEEVLWYARALKAARKA